AGSSSVKLPVFEVQEKNLVRVINACAVRLFHQDAQITIHDENKIVLVEKNLAEMTIDPPNHKVAIEFFLGWLSQQQNINLVAVGHRVVHGGPKYANPVVITDDVNKDLNSYRPLAPLHQQHNLAPVPIVKELYPDLLQIACFDTAFHQTMPEVAKRFALPEKYYVEGVRRYGFHGLSYEYVVQCLSNCDSKKIIIAHLGNGASMCAVAKGKSIATTMSFTPLDGLVMGTRCGDLDPGVVLHLMTHYSLSAEEISSILYKTSGLLGVSNDTNNMRKLLESNSQTSKKAVDLFCYQVNRHIGALVAELGGLDQLIFTAGIGENASIIREKICGLAKWLGLGLDSQANQENRSTISNKNSSVEISVIPTNEALMIAKHAMEIFKNT
ncbi:MAG: acetate/propionate family kinase, partial [Gammaproteobacteria bacterium]|nr:acetate/propionate family kinase [Gammaproteobacteria bacterium]